MGWWQVGARCDVGGAHGEEEGEAGSGGEGWRWEMSVSIDGTIKRTDGPLTSSECSVCGEECVVGMQIAYPKDGEWLLARYCRPCAKWLGELEEGRGIASIAVAESAGV
jgi:hypothetical protein